MSTLVSLWTDEMAKEDSANVGGRVEKVEGALVEFLDTVVKGGSALSAAAPPPLRAALPPPLAPPAPPLAEEAE